MDAIPSATIQCEGCADLWAARAVTKEVKPGRCQARLAAVYLGLPAGRECGTSDPEKSKVLIRRLALKSAEEYAALF